MFYQRRLPLWSSGQSSCYRTEMYCVSCEVLTEFIYLMQKKVDRFCDLVVGVPVYTTEIYCFLWGTNWIDICYVEESRPPLWSSGQCSWLQNGDAMCFLWGTNWIYICYVEESRPPLWPSGQSSCLRIQKLVFDSRRYQIFWEAVGLERGSNQPRECNWGATWKKK
jgi:hypothetical protein